MELKDGEYTTNSLIAFLTKKFGQKTTKKDFNHSDIAQYCLKGYLPYKYGGNKLTVTYPGGIKIIKLEDGSSTFRYGEPAKEKKNIIIRSKAIKKRKTQKV